MNYCTRRVKRTGGLTENNSSSYRICRNKPATISCIYNRLRMVILNHWMFNQLTLPACVGGLFFESNKMSALIVTIH